MLVPALMRRGENLHKVNNGAVFRGRCGNLAFLEKPEAGQRREGEELGWESQGM